MPRLHDSSATLIPVRLARPGTKSVPPVSTPSLASRPAKAIASPEWRFTLLFPIRRMCYKRPSEGCPDMAQKQAVSPLPGDLATLAGSPPQAASTAKAKPMEDAYREVQHSELPSAFCPRCSARLEPRSCKLICSSAGTTCPVRIFTEFCRGRFDENPRRAQRRFLRAPNSNTS